MRNHRSILVAALALAGGDALATTGHEGAMQADMKGCRMMHDGKMTPEAHRKHADEMFRKLDADADGTITRAEFDQHHENMMKQRLSDESREDHDHSEQHK